MEGSTEDSSGHQTHHSGADSTSHNNHTKSKSKFEYDTEAECQDDNLSGHLIDVSGYVPPEMDDQTENLLSMSIRIDPHNPFDEATINEFLSNLNPPLHTYDNYVEESTLFTPFSSTSFAYLGQFYIEVKVRFN